MPTFRAPRPVPVTVDVPFARLHVVASDRDDVVVTVLPTDPSKSGSVRAAEEIRVERSGDGVAVTYPGSWKQWMLPFASGTADITVELPTGSEVRGKAGSVHAEGALRVADVSASGGDARLDTVERLALTVGAGSVHLGKVGTAAVKVAAGSVRVEEITGDVTVKSSTGTTSVGLVTGSLTVQGANGDISVGRVRGDVTARSAYSSIRVDSLESGSVTLTTSFGAIDVGVPEGTAAYLDLTTERGTARNQLTPTDGPVADETTAEIHASTGYGDIVVRRPHA